MEFECFGITTQGCTDGMRIGLHPFDTDGPTIVEDVNTGAGTSNPDNGNAQGSFVNQNALDKNNNDDDKLVMIVAIVGAILGLLLIVLIVMLICCMRQRKRQAQLADPTRPIEGVFKMDPNNNPSNNMPEYDQDLTAEDLTESTPPPSYLNSDLTMDESMPDSPERPDEYNNL